MKNELNVSLLDVDLNAEVNNISDLEVEMASTNCHKTSPEKLSVAFASVC